MVDSGCNCLVSRLLWLEKNSDFRWQIDESDSSGGINVEEVFQVGLVKNNCLNGELLDIPSRAILSRTNQRVVLENCVHLTTTNHQSDVHVF